MKDTRKDSESISEDMEALETMIRENPCKMNHSLMSALKETLHSIILKNCVEGASRAQVAEYLHIDVRTLSRWRNEYEDFPKPKREGHKEITYSWYDVIKWKNRHKEIIK